jgi:hypothetical protein
MSASKSLLALWSIFGLEPGRLFALRGERAALLGELGVALDGGAAHPEGASGFTLGRAPSEGLDDLLPEVFGVGVHRGMVPVDHLRCKPL